jgi:Tfp pilus assembly protein PilF
VTASRVGVLVFLLAVGAYANSLGNGFAYDDESIIVENPVLTGGDWAGALRLPWWTYKREGTGLYRPLTSAALAVQWDLFRGDPTGYHLASVFLHSTVSLLVFLLLLEVGTLPGALAGGAAFAVHPLHTEAVANVVGQAELLSALFFLTACLLYLKGRVWEGIPRHLRTLAIPLLYLFSLASKEIGVTLPGALVLLELLRPRDVEEERAGFTRRLWKEAPTFLLMGAALLSYLGLRFLVLGSLGGEMVAPVFQAVGPRARVLTALALWVQFLRLLLFPLDLASDYDPGVIFPSEGLDLGVFLGLLCLGALAVLAVRTRAKAPLMALGVLWFVVVVLPVSNLLFPTGVLLAERTLYLPSVGLALAVAGVTPLALSLRLPLRRWVMAAAMAGMLGLFLRTVERNPSWASSFEVARTLAREHPESWRAFRTRALALEGRGEMTEAAEEWDTAVKLTPFNYTLLVEAGEFHGREGDEVRGETYLHRAMELEPTLANAYQILAGNLLRRGLGREAHGVALAGLAQAGTDQRLWASVSESYLLKGDLPAAVRAREAAIGADPSSHDQWARLAEIFEEMGDTDQAEAARGRAARLREAPFREASGVQLADPGTGGMR